MKTLEYGGLWADSQKPNSFAYLIANAAFSVSHILNFMHFVPIVGSDKGGVGRPIRALLQSVVTAQTLSCTGRHGV